MVYSVMDVIAKVIDDAEALLPDEEDAPHDYQSLKHSVIHQDLQEEVTRLKQSLTTETLIESFRHCCQLRYAIIANTCISYFAMPQSACNALYLKLTELLLAPNTMGELLQIIAPNVKTLIYPDYLIDDRKKLSINNVGIVLNQTNILDLKDPVDIDTLRHFVVTDGVLFDLRHIANYNFQLHEKIFHELNKKYPKLAQQIYQHNAVFRNLNHQLIKTKTPLNVLQSFILELQLGGEKFTGSLIASIEAQQAFTDFLSDLHSLPKDIYTQLLALKSAKGKTIDAVIQDLKNKDCVETAAANLKEIINNPLNSNLLNRPMNVSEEQRARLKRQYKVGTCLDTALAGGTTNLPTVYQEYELSKIVIHSVPDYLSMLLELPPELYAQLLTHATFNMSTKFPRELAHVLKNDILNEERKKAFYKAVLATIKSYDTIRPILEFAVQCNDNDFLTSVLALIPFENRLPLIKQGNPLNGQTILHLAARNPSTLLTILKLYPKGEWRAAIKCPDLFGQTPLHFAIQETESFELLHNKLPIEDQRKFIEVKDCLNRSPFHWTTSNPDVLKILLELTLPEERKTRLTEPDVEGTTPLHLSSLFSPECVRMMLPYLVNKHYPHVLALHDRNNVTPLHMAALHTDTMVLLLSNVLEKQRLKLLIQQDSNGFSCFDLVAHDAKQLKILLEFLPKSDRLNALKSQGKKHLPLLHRAICTNYVDSVRTILETIDPNDRPKLFQLKDDQGKTAFDLLEANQQELKQEMLSFLPPSNYSFYLTCFCCVVTTLIGAALLVLGIASMQPATIIAGSTLLANTALFAGLGFFSSKAVRNIAQEPLQEAPVAHA